MRSFTWRQWLRYRFDEFMSRGTLALIGGLSVAAMVLIVGLSFVVHVAGLAPVPEGEGPVPFSKLVWMSLMRTLDAGTMGGDAGSWSFLMAMLAVTLSGIFVVSILIGILSSGIESRLDELRKGRSLVVERGHTVLLGWSPQVFSLVSELVIANENQASSCIVILAEKDKVEMEDEIRAKVGSTGRTKIVCRSGSPTDLTDLDIVNPYDARSIVITLPEEGAADADAQVIKTILALTNNPNRRPDPYHIVAAMHDPGKAAVARMVGRDEVRLVVVGDLIARITAQTCRQSGLSTVYTELLDFGGDEIYFAEERDLIGKTFGEALMAYEDSAIMGLRRAGGKIVLKPLTDTILEATDRLIAISEDDDTVRLSGLTDHAVDASAIRANGTSRQATERTLILGWNRRAVLMVEELDRYVTKGSGVTVMADDPDAATELGALRSRLENQTLSIRTGDTQDRPTLDALEIQVYDHVIVLSDSDRLEVEDADSRTLVTLLHLRDIRSQSRRGFSIVSEMLDVRNRELAEVTQADDFIVSDKLVSLMLSQISENRELTDVFAELFGSEGTKLSFKPAEDYVETDREINFYTVVEAARRRGEVAIGYRAREGAEGLAHGVVVNPKKSNRITFRAGDRVVVLTYA